MTTRMTSNLKANLIVEMETFKKFLNLGLTLSREMCHHMPLYFLRGAKPEL